MLSVEIQILLCAIVMGLLHLLATVPATIAQHGIGYVFSARDEDRPASAVAARLQRAFNNFMQTFPFFAVAVLTAHGLQQHNALTVLGAQLYIGGRLLYIPIYLAGIPVLRTLAWLTALGGIVTLLVGLA